MRAKDHREAREQLGAYVLDQLAPADRARTRAHLAGCADCRAEVAGLGPVAAALTGLDPDSLAPAAAAVADGPPERLAEDVLAHVRARRLAAARRARRQRFGGGILVAASLGGAFAFGGWFFGARTAPPVVPVALRVLPADVRADAGLVRHTWGTELDLEATGLVKGGSYTVTFVRDDGRRVDAGTFLGTGAAPVRCKVNAALALDTARGVEVTDASGTVVMDASVG